MILNDFCDELSLKAYRKFAFVLVHAAVCAALWQRMFFLQLISSRVYMKRAYKPSVNILCILLALEDVQQNEQCDILEIIFIIWIVPGALGDVPECGH